MTRGLCVCEPQVIRPLIRIDGDSTLQKRAYRVLGALCEHKADELLTEETLQDLLPVLTDSLVTCHVSGTTTYRLPPTADPCWPSLHSLPQPCPSPPLVSPTARQMRLRVLSLIVGRMGSLSEEHSMQLAGLVGEVLLCLKDSNAKAREAAYELLLAMAHARVEAGEADLQVGRRAALGGRRESMIV